MSVITNKDFEIMCKVEDLLYKKLKETNGIKDIHNGEEYYYFDENDEEYKVWVEYWNMVERFINYKKKANEKSAKYNKDNAEYHRLSNNLYWARRRKNKEKIEFYTKKLEEYKKKKEGK